MDEPTRIVKSAEVAEALVDVAGDWLSSRGFVAQRPHTYIRPVGEQTFHLLGLMALKGRSYVLNWGVSLPFVPNVARGRLVFHGTAPTARLDVFCVGSSKYDWPSPKVLDLVARIDGLHGPEVLRESMTRVWERTIPEVDDWFREASTVAAVCALARNQGESSIHAPNPQFVYALCLARLGKVDDAAEILERMRSKRSLPAELDEIGVLALVERVRQR